MVWQFFGFDILLGAGAGWGRDWIGGRLYGVTILPKSKAIMIALWITSGIEEGEVDHNYDVVDKDNR